MIVHDVVQKVAAEHLARKAVVYLRQSSPQQVKQNKESQHLQYALVDRAKTLGFRAVEVIDCDLGANAGFAAEPRAGFKQLLASVTLGEVGIVLSRELSRLSRTDKDWCQLMELCHVFNTLLADADHLYDLNALDDQLILGIKGTLSVVELKVLKLRLLQGMQAKAKRGELVRVLAPGFVRDGANGIVKDPNLRVQQAIELLFKKFRELGSIRQVHRTGQTLHQLSRLSRPPKGRQRDDDPLGQRGYAGADNRQGWHQLGVCPAAPNVGIQPFAEHRIRKAYHERGPCHGMVPDARPLVGSEDEQRCEKGACGNQQIAAGAMNTK